MSYRITRHGRLRMTAAVTFLVSALLASSLRLESLGDVDVAIVLAVDVSFSIDREDALRQRDGHVQALRSTEVIRAIRSGPRGCIAIAYIEWSGSGAVRHVLPWTLICDESQAEVAARNIEENAFSGLNSVVNGRTSVSYAIDLASLMLDRFPVQAGRKVIDISSNGVNNDGVPLEQSRSRALSRGHVINAIVLVTAERGINAILPRYYRENVIGGLGAFVMTPSRSNDYSVALLKKLVHEIAGTATLSGLQ